MVGSAIAYVIHHFHLIFSGWPRLFFDLPTLRVIFFGED
jgi:hypothetical protein